MVEAELDIEPFAPLSAEELSQTIPKVNPESDLEYLYYRSVVNDRDSHRSRRRDEYSKLKVYTEAGLKELDVVHIPYIKGREKISRFRARITNPDGAVSEFDDSSLYERKILKVDAFKGNALTFALPQLQVGSIVEYSWRSTLDNGQTWWIWEYLENEWPSELTRIEFIPSKLYSSTTAVFNYDVEFEKTKADTFVTVARNVPGAKGEPYAPPGRDYRGWLYLVYSGQSVAPEPDTYWQSRAKHTQEFSDSLIKSKQGRVKKLAAELFAGIQDSETKLHKAFEYCTENITNIHAVETGYTDAEIEKLKDVDTPAETIKRGYGSGGDINQLFASLAVNAGFEVCYVYTTDSHSMRFRADVVSHRLNFPEWVVALRKNKKDPWRYFDLSYVYLPFEWLDAPNIGQTVLLPNKKKVEFDQTKFLPADHSPIFRDARLSLNKYGDLTGTVQVEYYGYPAIARKRFYHELSEGEREEQYCSTLRDLFPQCEIRKFKMDNIFTRGEPLSVSYEIEIPGYGEYLGKRIIFQPNFFQFGSKPMFRDAKRRSDIAFKFAWSEHDTVWITLPDGFKPEEAASPGVTADIGFFKHSCTFALNASQTKLRTKREFIMDNNGFKRESYSELKKLLEDTNRIDTEIFVIAKEETVK